FSAVQGTDRRDARAADVFLQALLALTETRRDKYSSITDRLGAAARMTNVTCRLGDHEVVRAVTAYARPGDLTLLMGPRGAGKTTLLNLLSGHQKPDRGEVEILLNTEWVSAAHLSAAELATKGVGRIEDDCKLTPSGSVLEAVMGVEIDPDRTML